jgi:tRNA-specific 2-thiouridylase
MQPRNPTTTTEAAPRILAALSGGVDSSVAALLLVEAGFDVVGVFMRNGVSGSGRGSAAARSCCSASDARDAAQVADRLGIPFYAVDYEAEFGALIDRFAAEYRAGRTPNPCVLCNQELKFGHLFSLADALGATAVATGHYARVERGALRRARDADKDQTYYLFGVAREALARVRFPLGDLTKAEVRARARAAGLPTAAKPESMEICFVTSGSYRDVVRARGGGGASGRFVDECGRELGRHDGVDGFTVGQRRGLPALGRPHFVKAIRPDGDVVLCERDGLLAGAALVAEVNWLAEPAECDALVQIRARSPAAPARVVPLPGAGARIEFRAPASAVTPGQAAVFYDGDRVLGGGWLRGALEAATTNP